MKRKALPGGSSGSCICGASLKDGSILDLDGFGSQLLVGSQLAPIWGGQSAVKEAGICDHSMSSIQPSMKRTMSSTAN